MMVKLPAFEGPLDLLLQLLDQNKINIYDIPIVTITEQYLAYLDDLDSMSEFLLMAASLIDRKARMLLPIEEAKEDEADPREELMQMLLEYKRYQNASKELREKMALAEKAFFKPSSVPKEVLEHAPPIKPSELLSAVSLSSLEQVFHSVLKRQEGRIDPVRSGFGRIEKEEVSLEEKMHEVEAFVASQGRVRFQKLLEEKNGRMEIIVTFLAILELMRIGKLAITQKTIYDDIYLEAS